jgi:hypothetical protein
MTMTVEEVGPSGLTRRRSIVAVAVLAAIIAAFFVGRHQSGTATIRHGQAISLVGVVGVLDHGASKYTIPLDVAWVGSDGGYRSDGRPECVPPVGIGTIPVTFATVKVKDPDGYERDLTVWVDCTGWNPDEDLTPRQAANLKENLPGE